MFRFTILGKRPPRKWRRNSDSALFAAPEEVEEETLVKLKQLENTVHLQEERIKILEQEVENLPQLFQLETGVSSETSKRKKYYTINQERLKSIIVYFIINKVIVTICRVHISMILTSHESFRIVQHPYVLVNSDSWKYFFIMRCRVLFSVFFFFFDLANN